MLLNIKRIKIAETFILNPDIKITASQIARDKNLNQKSTALFLEELEQELILKSKLQGKNKLYSLNNENLEILTQYLCAVEHLRTKAFYEKNTKIKLIIEKIIPHITGIALIFGSYAKDTHKKTSDLDILIIGRHDKEKIHQISKTYNIEINIKEQKTFEINTLTKEVIKNHITIKNTEEYIRTILSLHYQDKIARKST